MNRHCHSCPINHANLLPLTISVQPCLAGPDAQRNKPGTAGGHRGSLPAPPHIRFQDGMLSYHDLSVLNVFLGVLGRISLYMRHFVVIQTCHEQCQLFSIFSPLSFPPCGAPLQPSAPPLHRRFFFKADPEYPQFRSARTSIQTRSDGSSHAR